MASRKLQGATYTVREIKKWYTKDRISAQALEIQTFALYNEGVVSLFNTRMFLTYEWWRPTGEEVFSQPLPTNTISDITCPSVARYLSESVSPPESIVRPFDHYNAPQAV